MFDVDKATQIASYLVWKCEGHLEASSLLSLMYLAEREFLLRHGDRLTGDMLVAQPDGPALSETARLFQTEGNCDVYADWIIPSDAEFFFRKMDQVDSDDPLSVFDMLSEADVEVLDEVLARYGHLNASELLVAGCCPEYSRPIGSARQIDEKTLLIKHGKSPAEADRIVSHLTEKDSVVTINRVFA